MMLLAEFEKLCLFKGMHAVFSRFSVLFPAKLINKEEAL